MNIVCCTDKNYIMPTGIMMYSLCQNNQGEDITFYVIVDESVDDSLRKQLLGETSRKFRNVKVAFVDVDSTTWGHLPNLDGIKKNITIAAYYRLFISELLPPPYGLARLSTSTATSSSMAA